MCTESYVYRVLCTEAENFGTEYTDCVLSAEMVSILIDYSEISVFVTSHRAHLTSSSVFLMLRLAPYTQRGLRT